MWQWGPSKQGEARRKLCGFSHPFFSAWQKGETAQCCDQREFVWKISLLQNFQATERRFFNPVILLHFAGAGSGAALLRLHFPQPVLNPDGQGCWCLVNFFSLRDLQK